METFLTGCREALEANRGEGGQRFHVVLGNEACDMDSMVSVMAYAYFLSKTLHTNAAVLPILNIPQSEFALRTDNVFLLRQSGVSQDLLLFREQLDLLQLQKTGRLALTLVDHNVLPSSDRDLEGAVVEVIDHRLLEREPSSSCLITVEMVGSCATLVTERIVQNAPEILDPQLALLLYGTIVLDCVNMAPEAGKVTPKDSQHAAQLETRFPSLPPRGALFQSLQNARFDVSVQEFLQRADLEQDLSAFCVEHGYNMLVAMTISFRDNKEPFRQLAIFSHSALCREEMSQALEQAYNPALSLSPISSPHSHIQAYLQGNTQASRKKVLPIIKDFLSEREQDGYRGGQGEEEEEEDSQFPPTPMNSLVEGCPLDNGLPRISAQALEEKFSKMADQEERTRSP
ncbi:hypothetical protein CRUP_028487 [Coryphaenoides rupestris]|nr:hypothetical protein CRUP_028487 [Coryphaenoides rupestris]